MPISLRTLCLVTAVLCNVQRSLEHEIPRRSFLSRRAIDGTRGRKYFDPREEGAFDSYGSAGGQYDPYDHMTDLSDIRKNVPGEPGVDYPAYSTLPQTGFTCEGRSRGYYADEAAGCQVFHVCHDVLVSSFLCPIGSTFSQKLLTCDWWTKVDCSATGRYVGANRNNYQIDDDEMIRNAYAMISLQSTEDVTKDGLVDPDSGARIVDYSAFNGRTVAGYTPGFRRITDYPVVDATGNDLPSGYEDYPRREEHRRIDSYDHHYQRQRVAKTNLAYRGKFRLESKERSPYHASPIIRHGYQAPASSDNEFQDDYRRPDGFTNRLQASYAPTVPTVTTTTRRLYSPTIPTTYRPSTLAYSKLDLLMDSSDHLYAHSKSLGNLAPTPPTIIRRNDDSRNIESRASEVQYDDLKKSENVSSARKDRDDRKPDSAPTKRHEVRFDLEEKSETSFRINVTDVIDEDEVFRQQNDRPVIRNESDEEESLEDIEAKDSVGIARALSDPSRRIIVQNQDPIDQTLKDERTDPTTFSPLRTNADPSSGSYGKADVVNSTQTPKTPDVVATNETSDDRPTGDYEDIADTTTRSFEETAYTRSFGDRTTPLLPKRTWRQRDDSYARASTIPVTAIPATVTTEGSVDATHDAPVDGSSSNNSRTIVDRNSLSSTSSVSSFNDESVASSVDPDLEDFPRVPVQFLQPPPVGFLISIPEETRYATIRNDGGPGTFRNPESTTTEIPRFSSTTPAERHESPPAYNENDRSTLIDYADVGSSVAPNSRDRSADRVITVSTLIPWLVSSWPDRSIADIPATDVVPPIVDYNDGFDDFVPPDRDASGHSQAGRSVHSERESQGTEGPPTIPKNGSGETEVLSRYNTEFQFTIRDAIRTEESKVDSKSPCNSTTSDERARRCETSYPPAVAPGVAISTPATVHEEEAVSIGARATAKIPEQRISSDYARSIEEPVTFVSTESPSSAAPSSIGTHSNIDADRSSLKAITPRNVPNTVYAEEQTEKPVDTTTSDPLRPNRPGSSRGIEEAIDRHDFSYEVSLRKNDDLKTTSNDFISRLITQHQPQSFGLLNEQLSDFEIVKSIEPEDEVVTPIPQTSKFLDFDYAPSGKINGSPLDALNDTVDRPIELNSNVSMLSLLQLMAELLKLDRLPRPFSAKDLRNVELEASLDLDQNEPSFVTTSPLSNYSPTSFGSANFGRAPVFGISETPVNIAESKVPSDRDEPSFVTADPPLDRSQGGTLFGNANAKAPTFDDTPGTTSNVLAFRQTSPDVSATVKPVYATGSKTSRSRIEAKTRRPLQKQEILEQLTENLGRPLYRGDSIRKPLVFDLPQVQRSLDFETGLLLEESKYITNEAEKGDPVLSTTEVTTTTTTTTTTQRPTTTTESEKIVVETEFVPSIGFSLDTNEGREEYVEAVLDGLIDNDGVLPNGGKNESSVAQLIDASPRNGTSGPDDTRKTLKRSPMDVERKD